MSDLDPAAIVAEHEWHHETCAVLLSPHPLTLVHCVPYRLAAALAEAQEREQRVRALAAEFPSATFAELMAALAGPQGR